MTFHNVEALHKVKDAIRNPFAWPGGYALVVLLDDGESIHVDCAKNNFAEIARSALGNYRDGWTPLDTFVNWEDNELCCASCNKRIISEYAN
jgi:hypothetical protein